MSLCRHLGQFHVTEVTMRSHLYDCIMIILTSYAHTNLSRLKSTIWCMYVSMSKYTSRSRKLQQASVAIVAKIATMIDTPTGHRANSVPMYISIINIPRLLITVI